jgi:DNA-binding transcriptional ArsR family regulator
MHPSPTHQICIHRDADLARYFRLIGDPLKLRIIKLLSKQPMNVNDLTDSLNSGEESIGRSAVSNALSVLEVSGMVRHSLGRIHRYSINKPLYRQVMKAGLDLVGEEEE